MLTAALSVFTAAGGLTVAAAKKALGPRISVFVVVVTIVRSLVNVVAWGLDNSTDAEANNGGGSGKHRVPPGAGIFQTIYHKGYLLYLMPVTLFTLSDTIAFLSLSRLNPATFSLVWNCKTAFVAVLFRFFIKRQPMAWHKWAGVALLLIGPGTAEIGNLWHMKQNLVHTHRDDAEMGSGMSGHAHPHAGNGGAANESAEAAAVAASMHFQVMSVMIALGGSLCSACANVCYEWVLKLNAHHSFWEQMLVSNSGAVIMGIIVLLCRVGFNAGIFLLHPENLFTGFTGVAALAVMLQATSGLVAAAVLRYVDNIADLFAHAGAMFITAVMSYLFFELEPSVVFCTGLLVSVVAFVVYYAERVLPHAPTWVQRTCGFGPGVKHADSFGDVTVGGSGLGGPKGGVEEEGGIRGGRVFPGDDL